MRACLWPWLAACWWLQGRRFLGGLAKVSLTPDGGATSFLAEFMSRQLLTELCLTGERISGERMHAHGCINRLSGAGPGPGPSAGAATGPGAEVATARIKALCRRVAHSHSLEQRLALEADHMVEAQGSESPAKALRPFWKSVRPTLPGCARAMYALISVTYC